MNYKKIRFVWFRGGAYHKQFVKSMHTTKIMAIKIVSLIIKSIQISRISQSNVYSKLY